MKKNLPFYLGTHLPNSSANQMNFHSLRKKELSKGSGPISTGMNLDHYKNHSAFISVQNLEYSPDFYAGMQICYCAE